MRVSRRHIPSLAAQASLLVVSLCHQSSVVLAQDPASPAQSAVTPPPQRAGEPSGRVIPEITITAEPLLPGLLEYGTAASVVSREELLLKGKSTIGEALSNEPGVSSSYFGPGASRPIIRGNSGERVRVLLGGTGSQDVSSLSEDHAVTIDPFSVEQAEVLRGPETLLYGSSAIGGVVNLSDSSIPETPVGAAATGDALYQMGTGDEEISGAARAKGELGSFNWYVSGFSRDTNDIDIPGFAESSRLRAQEAEEGEAHEEDQARGTLPSSATRTKGATVGGSYVWDRGFFGASVHTFRSKYGVPGHEHAHGDEPEHGDEHGDEHGEEHGEEHSEEGNEHDEDHSGEAEDHHAEAEHAHDSDQDEEGHSTTAGMLESLLDHSDEVSLHGDDEEGGVAIDMEQIRVDLRGEIREVSSTIDRIRLKTSLSNYDHKELEGSEVGTRFENDAIESRVEVVHHELSGFKGVVGMQVQASDFNSVGEEAYIPENTVFAPAAFIYEEYDLSERWKLQAGGRLEYAQIDPTGHSTAEFLPFSLSTGAVYDVLGTGDYLAGLSLAYTQRAPTAAELFSNGAHVARQIIEIGNESLDEEAALGAELTFKKTAGLVTSTLNLFVQQYDDYINLDATGEEDDGFPVFAYDDVRAQFWGFELEGVLHLTEALGVVEHDVDLEGQVDFVRARNLSDSSDFPRIPPLRTQVRLRYTFDKMFTSYLEGVFVNSQSDVAEFELPTDSYQLLNAAMEYTLPIASVANLSLFAQGFNLTDEEARVHASFLKDIAPLPGRTGLFGIRGRF